MMLEDIIELIDKADMVLVGLGEEFNDVSRLKKQEGYLSGRTQIEASGNYWMLPAYEQYCRELVPERQKEIQDALMGLAKVLEEKNYFVISTSVNKMLRDIPWKEGRLVMPCGDMEKKQCPDCCDVALQELTRQENDELLMDMEQYCNKKASEMEAPLKARLGNCPRCGKELILNNIYAEKYDENGYISQWQLYTKWLQGTLNRNVLILELGAGMKFPSVIRWPFEKIAFFNNKASFYRVNEKLYQMSEELKGKGISIAKNSVDWLLGV